jgi:hypothetical protein
MATTRPHSATNGHGNSGGGKLERLLAYHEHAAEAIRTTIGLMNGHATTAKTNGHASVLADAIALDGARRAKTGKKKKRVSLSKPGDRAAILAQRARTLQALDAFSTKKPSAPEAIAQALGIDPKTIGIGPLRAHGYLKKKGDGYVRTAKAYVVDKYAAASA